MRPRRLPALILPVVLATSLWTCTDSDGTGPEDAPFVTSVSPVSGPTTGGTVVTVTGGNFPSSVSVMFGLVPAASVVVESESVARVTTPGHAPGTVDVTVTTSSGQSVTSPGAFTFVLPTPTLSGVSPDRGPTSGGTSVTLTGTGFQSGATVTFGGVAASSVQFSSPTRLQAVTPPGTPGSVAVSVGNPDGQSAALAGAFSYLAAPTVASVSPTFGPVAGGTAITVTGSGFTAGTGVTVGGRAATSVVVQSATTITAITPSGPVGAAAVAVSTPEGGSASLASAFTYVGPPAVTSVSPGAGTPGGGTEVLITGAGFMNGVSVRFGASLATQVTFLSSTSLRATTPSGPPGPVAVTVTNSDGQSGTLAAGAAGGFRYFVPPTVTSVLPSGGNASGGTAVTINGTGFAPGAAVRFGETSATGVSVLSSTVITATTPAGSLGPVTVSVTNPDGESGSLVGGFTYTSPPTLTSVSPGSGPIAGGTSLTLSGSGFVQGATVTVGGSPATEVQVLSSSSITAVTPAGSAGAATVAVTNPDGGSAALGGAFTYLGPPTVTSVSPGTGSPSGGTRVEISGTGFQPGASVSFGGSSASGVASAAGAPMAVAGAPASDVTVVSSTRILATTPPGSSGPAEVRVTNPDGQSAILPAGFVGGFVYLTPPAVLGVSPSSGTTQGGTALTITGRDFQNGAQVTFNDAPATSVSVVSSSSITAVTPAGTAGGATVRVTNPDGESGSLESGFTYVDFFSVTSVSPSVGEVTGGTLVTVTGAGFQSGATVHFGATASPTVTFVSSTTLTAVTPPGAAGTVGVTVTNPGATPGTLANAFTYTVFPTVTSVSPTSGRTSGGTAITITGTGFQAGATVQVGAASATGVTVVSATSITATTPSGAAGVASITVQNPDGGIATLPGSFTFVPPPAITSITPAFGPFSGGTAITITGTAFQAGAGVTIGGAAATGVTVVSATSITATTPAGAAGPADVVVTNPDGQSGMRTSGFTFVPPPTVTSISPTSGRTSGGNAVTITGTGFMAGAGVTIGGAAATGVTVVSATSITATTPAGTAGARDVVVTNADGQSGTLASGFTFVPPPTVTSVSPTSGRTSGGTAITITGTAFQTGATVSVGGSAATGVTVVSGTSITATTPSGAAGPRDIVVTNPDGQTGTLVGAFTFVPPPTISSVSPASGRTSGGNVVTITGTGFLAGAGVTFGGAAATGVTVGSATSITATTPAGAAGLADVVVTNTDGQTGTLPNGFTFVPPPTVASVSPVSGYTSGGTAITVTGTGFLAGAGVTVGGVAATGVTVVSATSITATTPAGAAGARDVVVTNADGQTGTLAGAFTYVPPPTVTGVSPTSGYTAGGTAITLTGTGFQAGATVSVGGSPATGVTVASATSITATTPAGAAGPTNIMVNNPDGQTGMLVGAYTFVPPPTVTSVAPTSGRTSGGNAITITGTGFLAGATVTVGGNPATGVTVGSATSITATTPAGTAGLADVVVTNTDGQTGTLSNGFTFVPPPTVTAISPDFDVTSGGKSVTITGTAFIAGATVAIGGAAATGVTFVSSTTLNAVVPAGSSGVVDVVVTNPDGQIGTLTNGFTYSSLAITSLSRDAGSAAGGATVLVNGSGFVSSETPTVDFGGTAAVTTFISSTQLSAVTPAHATGQVDVTVTQGAASFTLTGTLPGGGAFEFMPAPTTTYVSHDFEDGTVGSFGTDVFPGTASVAVGNWGAGLAVSGAQAVRATVPGGANAGARLTHLYSPQQPANEPNGVCQRWYIRTDAQTLNTLTSSATGQIKLLLNRSGTNPPSWLHIGVGKEFTGSAPNNITVFTDYNTGFVGATAFVPQTRTLFTIPADSWVEMQTCYLRTGGTGRARLWINGKLKFDHTDANFGTDDLVTKTLSWGFGLEYSQNTPAGVTLTLYTDDAKAANGFIDPGA